MRSALLLLALFAGGAVGCVNNDTTLSIIQMQAVTEMSNCIATGTASVELSRGTFDVRFVRPESAQGYVGFPIVRNNEQSRKPSADSPELNSIQVIGANVSLTFPDPAVALSVPVADRKFFWAAAGGRLDPAGSAAMQIDVVPINVVRELATALSSSGGPIVSVVAEIKPVGMQANDRIVGGPIFFPVDFCSDCLLKPLATCSVPVGLTIVPTCIPDQDQVATCCMDSVGPTICGSDVPKATASLQSPSN